MGEQVALLILSCMDWIRPLSPVIKDCFIYVFFLIALLFLAVKFRKWLSKDDPQDFDDNLNGGIA